MAVEKCFLSSDVYFSCMNHALSTEVEEIMGLLIGWTKQEDRICYITHTLPLKRLDKRKDRVEISPEVLSSSITVCERLNEEIQNKDGDKIGDSVLFNEHSTFSSDSSQLLDEDVPYLRVVGWYHSHPHITVYPSEVDLRTQEQYQLCADPLWIGLIFGVYNTDESTRGQHFQHIAFQSVKNSSGRLIQHLVPILVVPKFCSNSDFYPVVGSGVTRLVPHPSFETIASLRQSYQLLLEEEQEAYHKAKTELLSKHQHSPASHHQPPVNHQHGACDLRVNELSCVFHKNICKIVSVLANPLSKNLLEVCQATTAPSRQLSSIDCYRTVNGEI